MLEKCTLYLKLKCRRRRRRRRRRCVYLNCTSFSAWIPCIIACILWISCCAAASSCRRATCVAARRWFSVKSLWISLCCWESFCSSIIGPGGPDISGGGTIWGRPCWAYCAGLGRIRPIPGLLIAARALSTPADAIRWFLFDIIIISSFSCDLELQPDNHQMIECKLIRMLRGDEII